MSVSLTSIDWQLIGAVAAFLVLVLGAGILAERVAIMHLDDEDGECVDAVHTPSPLTEEGAAS